MNILIDNSKVSTGNLPPKGGSLLTRIKGNNKKRDISTIYQNLKRKITSEIGGRTCLSSPNRDAMMQEAIPLEGGSSHA